MPSPARIFTVRLPRNRRRLPLVGNTIPRIAQISLPGVLFEKALYFPLEKTKELEVFRPQALVGSAAHLLTLADQLAEGRVSLSQLDCAIFALTDFRDMPLSDYDRTALWTAFSVPVYELVLADDGSLLAAECEAQEGWHVEAGVHFSLVNGQLWYTRRGRQSGTGLVGELVEEPCPCGRAGKRIASAAIDYRDPLRQKLACIA